MAMPVKKKRKLDPQILRAREERRKKRITKALKKMEKKPRIARPIMELEPSVELIAEAETRRKRTNIVVSNDVVNSRELLMKEWNRFSGLRHISEIRQLDSVIISQQEALDVLREESEELYYEAIQPDMTLIPFQCTGPTRTPPIPDHFVDGTYEVSVLQNFFSRSLTLRQNEAWFVCADYFRQGILKGKYHCTADLLFDWFGISCMTSNNFCFSLQNRLIQTGLTGGQWYSDPSPFCVPCFRACFIFFGKGE